MVSRARAPTTAVPAAPRLPTWCARTASTIAWCGHARVAGWLEEQLAESHARESVRRPHRRRIADVDARQAAVRIGDERASQRRRLAAPAAQHAQPTACREDATWLTCETAP